MHPYRLSVAFTSLLAGATLAPTLLAADYQLTVTNLTRGIHFTPLIAAAHDPAVHMFHAGNPASAEMQAIAEGGDVQGMNTLLGSTGASVATGDGLVAPGQSVVLTLNDVATASVISLSGMLLPTNDGFVGIDSVALPAPPSRAATVFARGYDAGTEGNDELIGGGAPGVPGFPAPPPVVATGTGTGASGINVDAEGFVHVHPGVLGDLDPTGGVSDINAAVHHWQNPVARVEIVRLREGQGHNDDAPSAVGNLTGSVYSSSALELFWEPANSMGSAVQAYRITRNGSVVANLEGFSYFEEGLAAGTSYSYSVSAIAADGSMGEARDVTLMTNAH
ncbi:MAG: hypothetical protein HKN42_19775 [Granulosicoccus sp.]|nr:hypothetical protein [Granulosicoccus sp.]